MAPDPYFIQTAYLSIRWYGLLIAFAILLSYYLSLRAAKKEGVEETKFDTVFLVTIISGIVGARLGFVLQNASYYTKHFGKILSFWDGGLSIHGAIILGVIALYIIVTKYRLGFVRFANIVAPYLLLSGAIGRWGNYFNQEIIGKPTDSFAKMFVSQGARPIGFEKFNYFHPVFFYESLLLLIAFTLYFVFAKFLKKSALSYTLITYSTARIVVEFWRIDYKPIFLFFDLAQWVSFGIILVTIIVILTFRKK